MFKEFREFVMRRNVLGACRTDPPAQSEKRVPRCVYRV
jgi:hypothetical protein